ncbi:MAG: acetyl-CoA carboxylase biotin carboxyl carrier protein [bacterium]|nr:acetyl-CoA carboxylase biotin carboxyl carrier protein [bacterium]
MDVDLIKKLVDIVSYSNIEELRIGDRDIRITIKKSTKPYKIQEIPQESEKPQEISSEDKEYREGLFITSPIVGTFYRSPKPDAPPFVEVGDEVKIGQTLCIIEAMKLMNEVKSDHNGIIKQILVENGEPVEYGQPLFIIEPIGEN